MLSLSLFQLFTGITNLFRSARFKMLISKGSCQLNWLQVEFAASRLPVQCTNHVPDEKPTVSRCEKGWCRNISVIVLDTQVAQ